MDVFVFVPFCGFVAESCSREAQRGWKRTCSVSFIYYPFHLYFFFLDHLLLPSYSPQKIHFLLNIWPCYLIRVIFLEQPLIVLINRRDICSPGRGDAIFK